MANLKESELALTYESENPFSSEIEIAKKLKKKKGELDRATWGNGMDFLLSGIGYAGVFLIPYFTCMFLLGMPMVYLEFIVGIGVSINIANAFFCMLLNMIVAYALYFLVLSISHLTTELPWAKCNPQWSSANCIDDFSPEKFTYTPCDESRYFKCDEVNSANFGQCFNRTTIDGSMLSSCSVNATLMNHIGWWKTSFPSADYWSKVVLQKTSKIDESGGLVWELMLALLGVYVIIYFMLIRGIKVSGKAVYFTALFPYFVLLVLGIRAWVLPGAAIGIKYYISPDWSKLLDIHVWSDAATAIFFSISVTFGGMTTLASYNKFNANIVRDAIMIPATNCLTSFFAGFVIFAYMGYLSHITGQDIDNIIEAGQGLAFVVYPYAVTTLVGAPIWATLFFLMLVLLGISSSLAVVEATISSTLDAFNSLGRTNIRRYLTITAIFIIYFLLGLVFCLQSGTYWVEIFNTYTGDWGILFLGASECLIVCYMYGLKNFLTDMRCMMGVRKTMKSTYLWCILWSFICPALCIAVAIIALTKIKNIQIGDYVFPDWTLFLGQFMQLTMILAIFGGGIYAIVDALYIRKRDVSSLFKPDFESYVPKLAENQKTVRIARGLEVEENAEMIIDNLSYSAEDMQRQQQVYTK